MIDAQLQSVKSETKAWCAVFPRKVPVYGADEVAQKISASLSVALLFTKLSDSLQEKKSVLKSVFAKALNKRFYKAKQILDDNNFDSNLIFDEVINNQKKVELFKAYHIEEYAEPSARIAGEVFSFTAKLAKFEQNERILYDIGYNVGKVV